MLFLVYDITATLFVNMNAKLLLGFFQERDFSDG